MPRLTVAELARAVGGSARGDESLVLHGVAPLETATTRDASFLARPDYRRRAEASAAGCVIVGQAGDLPGRTVVVAKDPYRAFALALRAFHPDERPVAGRHPAAVVHETAVLGDGVHVGPLAVIAEGANVGSGSAVLAGAVVGASCVVGRDCTLHPGATLYPGTRLGDRVVVHARAVLGSDGFGYASGPDGHVKIPHVGCVVVEDDVEIGAGTCIDRGAMGETRIGAGTKIDNLVQVGHNVHVGRNALLVAQSGISGSTRLGDGVVMAGQSGMAGHLTIGDGARVAAKSAVLQDVAPGLSVGGIPAVPLTAWKRAALVFSRLPELARRVRRLERAAGGTIGGDEDDA